MKARILLLVATAIGLGACARNTPQGDNRGDELSGSWAVTYSERDGQEFQLPKKGTRFTFADGKVSVDGKPTYTYQADAAKAPKHIDFVMLKGEKADPNMVLRAIYKVEKDRLTMCIADTGKTNGKPFESVRPTEFTSGGKVNLLILKREDG